MRGIKRLISIILIMTASACYSQQTRERYAVCLTRDEAERLINERLAFIQCERQKKELIRLTDELNERLKEAVYKEKNAVVELEGQRKAYARLRRKNDLLQKVVGVETSALLVLIFVIFLK